MTRLPVELIDIIVEMLYLKSDHKSLQRFCLTNSHLVHICRKYLFQCITLLQRPRTYHPPPMSLWKNPTITSFAEVLKSNPELASYVQELRISSEADYDFPADPTVAVFDLLHNVKVFRFGFSESQDRDTSLCADWDDIDERVTNSICQFVKKNPITDLELYGINDLSHQVFGSSTSSIKGLTLRNCWICREDDYTPDLTVPPVQLERLTFSIDGTSTETMFWSYVPAVFDMLNLKSLTLNFTEGLNLQEEDPCVYLQLFLCHINSLENLNIAFQGLTADDSLFGLFFPDAPCKDCLSWPDQIRFLKTLSISFVISKSQNFPLFADLDEELVGFSSYQSLEEISLTVIIRPESTLDMESDALDVLKNTFKSGFSALRKLTLWFEFLVKDYDTNQMNLHGRVLKMLINGLKWAADMPRIKVIPMVFFTRVQDE